LIGQNHIMLPYCEHQLTSCAYLGNIRKIVDWSTLYSQTERFLSGSFPG